MSRSAESSSKEDKDKTAAYALGRNIRQWRQDHKVPLKALAADLQVSTTTVNDWERAARFPSGHHLSRLARVLGVPCCRLLCDRPEECVIGGAGKSCHHDRLASAIC